MVKCGTGFLVMCVVVFDSLFSCPFFPEMYIGLTEEFCVGKSELRGKKSMSFFFSPKYGKTMEMSLPF